MTIPFDSTATHASPATHSPSQHTQLRELHKLQLLLAQHDPDLQTPVSELHTDKEHLNALTLSTQLAIQLKQLSDLALTLHRKYLARNAEIASTAPSMAAAPKAVIASTSTEIALATGLSEHFVKHQCFKSLHLTRNYPQLVEAAVNNEFSIEHAETIAKTADTVTPELREKFISEATDGAGQYSVHNLQKKVTEHARTIDPSSRTGQAHAAIETRYYQLRQRSDVMSQIVLHIPSDQAAVADLRIKTAAEELLRLQKKAIAADPSLADQEASRSQLEADAAALLLTHGGIPEKDPSLAGLADLNSRLNVTLNVRVPFELLAAQHVSDGCGVVSVPGIGVIDNELGRKLMALAQKWIVSVSDRDGSVLGVETYRPTSGLRRAIEARDQHCRFPGCLRPAEYCEIDHTVQHSKGGKTSTANLGMLCRLHHMYKHDDLPSFVRWHSVQHGHGEYEWRSPLQRQYFTSPPGKRRYRTPKSADAPKQTDLSAKTPTSSPEPRRQSLWDLSRARANKHREAAENPRRGYDQAAQLGDGQTSIRKQVISEGTGKHLADSPEEGAVIPDADMPEGPSHSPEQDE